MPEHEQGLGNTDPYLLEEPETSISHKNGTRPGEVIKANQAEPEPLVTLHIKTLNDSRILKIKASRNDLNGLRKNRQAENNHHSQ